VHGRARDVDDVSVALGAHARQHAHGDAQRAEVVELHGALEVVQPIV
jgi:hypothetical protein